MLPSKIRNWLFDILSVQTMRYVSAVPTKHARGLTKKVYDMICDDFFKNGAHIFPPKVYFRAFRASSFVSHIEIKRPLWQKMAPGMPEAFFKS